jgi:endoglucanase
MRRRCGGLGVIALASWLAPGALVFGCSGKAKPGTDGGAGGGGGGGGGGAVVDLAMPLAAVDLAGPILAPEPVSPNLVVDQFGYRTGAEKIAVARDAQTGFDVGAHYTPPAMYAVVDAHSGAPVLMVAPVAWNGGGTDATSGDKAWWIDLSALTTPGDYFILDGSANVRSAVFQISDGVYRDTLVQAVRMLYYQRDGSAKPAQYAGAAWTDGAAHLTPCTLFSSTTTRDVHGGWFDAGDQNEYTSWGASDVIELLRAYRETPGVFGDDTNIPESGNGVPDLLDELKWELDWIVRMQEASDGSVYSVVGHAGASPPSSDTQGCKYGPATTGASFSAAAVLAFASLTLKSVPAFQTAYPGYADDLAARARRAWTWASGNVSAPITFYNSQNGIAAGEQELVDSNVNNPDRYWALYAKQLEAAVFLFELDGTAAYKTFIDTNYNRAHMKDAGGNTASNLMNGNWIDEYHLEEQDTLLEYARAGGATAAVSSAILTAYKTAMGKYYNELMANLTAPSANKDPYLATMDAYVWGSNADVSAKGNLFYDVSLFNVDSANAARATLAAERYVHYLHGVNPLQMVYLSNMNAHGATRSVTRFFHTWFANGTKWDQVGVSMYGPPPGYLVGGANQYYDCTGQPGCTNPSPPRNQPAQKSYKELNDVPNASWQVTEPDDGYQAHYIRLLSKLVK